jgi:hypothetical protein
MTFALEKKNGYFLMPCGSDITEATFPDFRTALAALTRTGGGAVLVDLQGKFSWNIHTVDDLRDVLVRLKATGVPTFFTGIPPEKVPEAHTLLNLSVVGPGGAVEGPKSQALLKREQGILEATQKSVEETCKLMAPSLNVAARPAIHVSPICGIKFDAVSKLEIWHKNFKGHLYLAFSKEALTAIMAETFGNPALTFTAEVSQGANELLNVARGIIRDGAKGYVIEGTIPTLEDGRLMAMHMCNYDDVLAIPFTVGAATFHAMIAMNAGKAE